MNLIRMTFLISLISLCFQASSQETKSQNISVKNNSFIEPIISTNYFNARHTDIKHSDIYKSTWYLTIDFKNLRQKGILDSLSKYNFTLSKQFIFKFDKLPKELHKVELYGNSLKRSGEVTAYLYGNLSNSMFEQYIKNGLYSNNGQSQLKKATKKRFRGNEQLVLEYSDSDQKIYAKNIRSGVFIVSNRIIYTRTVPINEKALREKNIENKNNALKGVTDLFILNIDTELARKNMELNLGTDGYIMQSQLFTKAKNIVAKIQLKDENIIIGSALTTNDEQIAIQIKKILDGITAYNSLTDNTTNNTLQSILMNNMIVERKEKNVHIGTYIPLDILTNNK